MTRLVHRMRCRRATHLQFGKREWEDVRVRPFALGDRFNSLPAFSLLVLRMAIVPCPFCLFHDMAVHNDPSCQGAAGSVEAEHWTSAACIGDGAHAVTRCGTSWLPTRIRVGVHGRDRTMPNMLICTDRRCCFQIDSIEIRGISNFDEFTTPR